MFSPTVISRKRLWFWGTCTIPARSTCLGLRPVNCSPRKVMVPSLGLSSPLIVASSVDLPQPFGPTTQVMPRSATVRLTLCSTSPPPYPAVSPSMTSAAAAPLVGPVIAFLRITFRGAEVSVEHAGVGPDRRRRAGRDDRAVVEHRDVMAQAHHELHVVLDNQERLAPGIQLPDPVSQLVDQRGVHAAGWLVEQHDRRVCDQHVGELEQLALAVRERPGELASVPGDAGELEQLHGPVPVGRTARPGEWIAEAALPAVLARGGDPPEPPAVLRGDDHVLQDREPRKDPGQ